MAMAWNGGIINHIVETGDRYSALPPTGLSSDEVQSLQDYRIQLAGMGKEVCIYKDIGQYYWSKGIKWQTVTRDLPDAGTLIRVTTDFLNFNNVQIGYLNACYYVAFRNKIP